MHRRRQLLEAGFELFSSLGLRSTRVIDVCQLAGLTERYFYENFESLDDLANAVFDQALEDVMAHLTARWTAEPACGARSLLEALANSLANNRRALHVLLVETNSGSLANRRYDIAERLLEHLAGRTSGSSRPTEGDRVALYASLGAIAALLIAAEDARFDLSFDQLVSCLEAVLGRIWIEE